MKIMTDDEFISLPKEKALKAIAKRDDPQATAAMETMIDSFSMQDDPHVGCFYYDPDTKSLFGIDSPLAEDIPFHYSEEYHQNIRTSHILQKKIWQKNHYIGVVLGSMAITKACREGAYLSSKKTVLLFLQEVGLTTIQKRKKQFYSNLSSIQKRRRSKSTTTGTSGKAGEMMQTSFDSRESAIYLPKYLAISIILTI